MSSLTVISINKPLLGKADKFENSGAITELSEALKLLAKSQNDRTRRFLVVQNDPPYIEIQLWDAGYTRTNYRSSTFFRLTSDLANLLKERFTEGVVYRAKVQDENVRELAEAGLDQIDSKLS